MRGVAAALAWLAAFGMPAALAATPAAVPMRMAPHAGYVRLVLDYGHWVGVSSRRTGNVMVLSLTDPAPIAAPSDLQAAAAPNLRAAQFAPGAITLTLAPGVTVRTLAVGASRVIDLIDPPDPSAVTPAPRPPAWRAIPAAVLPRGAAPAPVMAAMAVSPGLFSAASPVSRPLDGAPESAVRPALLSDPGGTLVLPFGPGTGAASFQRGEFAVVVFDEPRVIDVASLRAHAGAENAAVQQLAAAVVLRLLMPPGRAIALHHDGSDWIVDLNAGPPPAGSAIAVRADAGLVDLALAAGHVIAIPDPATGGDLLVGTTTAGGYVGAARRFAEFALLPTTLGVVVDPLSDRVALRTRPDGYRVESGLAMAPLAVSAAAAAAAPDESAATLSRSFDFPAEAAPALLRRLHAQVADAASAPVLGRLPYRRAVAQTMIALGLGAEAQGVLELATSDDPRGLADPPTRLISAAAALLAGRLDETAGLDPSGAEETDEQRLWRALRDAARLPDGAAPDAATTAAVATALPLLLRYPSGLAAALLPLAADTLLRGGDTAAADRLLAARPDDPRLDLARAVADQGHGQHEAALLRYDRLAHGRDRSVRARAAFAALDLRVADRRLTAADAADAADRLIYAWRGDARERDAWLRLAAWRGAAGQYRQQLEALRQALAIFPDPADGVHAKLVEAFASLMSGHGAAADALSPLDLVALVQENADLLPDGAAGEAMAEKLADRLAALDLPQRAEAVLERLVHDTTSPSPRAALAARLAAIELGENQAPPALEALTRTAAPDLSPELTERRALLAARAQTALGDRAGALASLSPLADPPALLLRAAVQEDAHDWPAAAAALGAYADAVLPATGTLDAPQSGIVLRLVSATAQANDEAGLARLRSRFGARLPTADDTTLMRVLTEQPVRGVADLPRLTRETEAAKRLPATLAAQ